jgi:uncharacterized protein (DUF362 family)
VAMRPTVILKDQATYDAGAIAAHVAEIVARLGTDVRGKSVFVKPSFVYPSKSPVVRGVITQPELLVGVLRALRDAGARRLMVGESSVMGPSRVSFCSTGVLPLLAGLAEPVFLDEEDEVEVAVKDPWVQERFRVPKIFLDADLYVSLPKIKTNLFAELTLTIKNNLGLLRQRARLIYHDQRIHQKLADLYKVRPPDLVIADCIVAGEGQGPMLAEPVELGLLVAGNNAVAVDRVACHLTGYAPEEVEHLKLLIDAGYGPATLDEIEIDGRQLLGRARAFRRPSASLAGVSPRLQVFQGTEVGCASGCVGLVRGAVDAYVQLFGADHIQPINVIVGKPIPSVPKDLDPKITLVLGDCAEPYRDRGAFVGGCCPRPLDIGLVLREILGPINVNVELADVMRGYAGHAAWRIKSMLAGKSLVEIENHPGMGRMFTEIMIMTKFRGKMKPTPKR